MRAGSDVSGDVSGGETVLAAQVVANGVAPAWTGLVEDYLADIRSGEWFSSASANDLATAAPHAITTTGTTNRTACLSIKIS